MQLRRARYTYDGTVADYYNYFRDYDPSIGRYVQSDPIGLAGGINTYTYVGGNPLRYSDPTGECPWCLVGAVLGGGLNIASQLATNGGNWSAINIQQVGFAAASGLLSGGLGTLTSSLRIGWNVAANFAGSGVISGSLTAAQNALNCAPQNNVAQSALAGAIWGGAGSSLGIGVSAGYYGIKNALTNSAWASATGQQRAMAASNAISGPYYGPGINASTFGTIMGNLTSNTISNLNQ